MLDLFKINYREKKKNFYSKKANKNVYKTSKHFPSPIREWNNSIYLYNKNALNLIPSSAVSALKIMKSYFNFFNKKLEQKIRTKRLLLRLRRLSSNKIFLSNGEFKHTNNKVLISMYLFNRQKHNYLTKIKKIYIKKFLSRSYKKNINKKITKRLRSICFKGFKALRKANRDKYLLIKGLDFIKNNKNYKAKNFKSLCKHTEIFYKKVLKKSLRKIELYFLYKQLIYINKSKLNYTYLQSLKKHLETLYNKNVEFSLINLKGFYLNSDIISETIKLKLKRKRKLLKTINKIKNKVKIHKKKIFLGKKIETKINKRNVIQDNRSLEDFIINSLKYRHVTGFRLETKGRLTRRYTASRSISKFRYKGNLLNIDSSYRGLSCVLLKGYLKSNVQYTKLGSKTRIGSFGIKG